MDASDSSPPDSGRRAVLRGLATGGALVAVGGVTAAATGGMGEAAADTLATLVQPHFQRMTQVEIEAALRRIERQAVRDHGAAISCDAVPPMEGVTFGFAINLSKCKGTRKCVEACVRENNSGRDGTLQNIRVLALPADTMRLDAADPYYDTATVPQPGTRYLPIQCQQCADPPCVQACPVQATWTEPDGIVVIDYDWCIGCRYCAVACPYWARHFNWGRPSLPAGEITPRTHYLGNRPRPRGVMEKCTFCLQRTRRGLLPACLEACPTGARVFGNLLDPNSDVRHVLANKPVFRLKEHLETNPKLWYFTDG
ncbi:MAG: 4Fe-4S dicluster domain-containing protein [Alphaproteobacteria bacterium]